MTFLIYSVGGTPVTEVRFEKTDVGKTSKITITVSNPHQDICSIDNIKSNDSEVKVTEYTKQIESQREGLIELEFSPSKKRTIPLRDVLEIDLSVG